MPNLLNPTNDPWRDEVLRKNILGLLAGIPGQYGDAGQGLADFTGGLLNAQTAALDPSGRVQAMSGNFALPQPEAGVPRAQMPYTSDEFIGLLGGDPSDAATQAGTYISPGIEDLIPGGKAAGAVVAAAPIIAKVGKRGGKKGGLLGEPREYYSGNARDIAHGLKDGNQEAINTAATEMAGRVPEGAILVPIPGHAGSAKETLALANSIAEKSGATVADVLGANKTAGQYATKKTGSLLTPDTIGTKLSGDLPSGEIFLVDNVISSGNTMKAAQDAIPNAKPLVFAVDSTKGTTPTSGGLLGSVESIEGTGPMVGKEGKLLARAELGDKNAYASVGEYDPELNRIGFERDFWKGLSSEEKLAYLRHEEGHAFHLNVLEDPEVVNRLALKHKDAIRNHLKSDEALSGIDLTHKSDLAYEDNVGEVFADFWKDVRLGQDLDYWRNLSPEMTDDFIRIIDGNGPTSGGLLGKRKK